MKADDGCRKGEVAAFLDQILFVDGSVDFAGNHAFFTTSSQDGALKNHQEMSTIFCIKWE